MRVNELYAVKVDIIPTAPLCFRQIPFSMIHIRTYPFMPPTSLAGWLERVRRLSNGEKVPFRATIPQQSGELIKWQADDDSESEVRIFLDMQRYCCLGAQPVGRFTTFTTWRQGPKSFTHGRFSALRKPIGTDIKDEQFQLHRWEYLLCERMQGMVLALCKDDLRQIQHTIAWGLNIGKEGYAYISAVSDPFTLQSGQVKAIPSTFLCMTDAMKAPRCEYHPLYFFKPKPYTGPEGYWFEMFARTPDEVELDYWFNHDHAVYIPQATVMRNRYFWWEDQK